MKSKQNKNTITSNRIGMSRFKQTKNLIKNYKNFVVCDAKTDLMRN